MTAQEHIFGPLSTAETRVEFVRRINRGVKHGNMIEPMAPAASQIPTMTVTIGLDITIDRVTCQILEPEPSTINLRHQDTKWDVINWKYYEIWRGQLPPRGSGEIFR